MTVAELSKRMSVKEFAKWQAYSLVEPFGDFTRHHMLAQLTSLLFNVNRGEKSKPLDANDFNHFLSKYDRPESKTVSPDQGWVAFETMLSAKADGK